MDGGDIDGVEPAVRGVTLKPMTISRLGGLSNCASVQGCSIQGIAKIVTAQDQGRRAQKHDLGVQRPGRPAAMAAMS